MLKLYNGGSSPFVRKTDVVLERVRTSILLGYIPPGTAITERQIKDILNVSSSPIREALNQLEAEGLLTRSPHVGTRVAGIEVEDAPELYAVQAILQSSAVHLCTKKLSDETIREAEKVNTQIADLVAAAHADPDDLRVLNYRFHMLVCGNTVQPWFTRLISALWIRLPHATIWRIPREARAGIRYHRQILDAIQKRDSRLASRRMREHLERSHRILYRQRGSARRSKPVG
jgi:DNA-binding GntR family transcriptional regulator